MAIEFNCPYCTAAIRVPDQFSGKRGRCPKCDTSLLVPDIVPKSAANQGPAAPPAVPPPPGVPAIPAVPPPSTSPAQTSSPVAVPAAQNPVFAAPETTSSLSRTLRRKKRRRKSRQIYSIGIPILCFVAFFGLLSVLYVFRTPELKGTLRGGVAHGLKIPRSTFPLASLTLSDEERSSAADAFARTPESFVSPRMTCTISEDAQTLTVDVDEGDGFVWLTLNPNSDPNLVTWIREHTAQLNRMRLEQIASTGADLCRDKIKKAAGTPVVFSAEEFRDDFGLNVHRGAFGFAVEAVAARSLSPCAHEDANGTLYFAMPAGTTTFTIRGRSVFGGKPLFPGEYTVTAATTSPATPAAESPPDQDASMEPDTDPPSETPADAGSNGASPGMDERPMMDPPAMSE